MFKNVSSQKIQLFAFDSTTNLPKTGDAANITAYVSKDHGAVTVLTDTSATEMDATNAKGVYVFDLTQGETNGDELTFTAKSSTGNVSITPRFVTTHPLTQFADAFLDRDMSIGTDSGSTTVRTPRQAFRFLRNKWDLAAGTLTVKKEDDSTTSWTAAVSTDAAAIPIIGSDPAG